MDEYDTSPKAACIVLGGARDASDEGVRLMEDAIGPVRSGIMTD